MNAKDNGRIYLRCNSVELGMSHHNTPCHVVPEFGFPESMYGAAQHRVRGPSVFRRLGWGLDLDLDLDLEDLAGRLDGGTCGRRKY